MCSVAQTKKSFGDLQWFKYQNKKVYTISWSTSDGVKHTNKDKWPWGRDEKVEQCSKGNIEEMIDRCKTLFEKTTQVMVTSEKKIGR